MSLYGEYVREREVDLKILESEKGFATYRFMPDGETVYLVDIYVAPAFRRQGTCFALADIIADEARACGCKYMIGTVVPQARGSTASLRVLLAYAMELDRIEGGMIVFKKGL